MAIVYFSTGSLAAAGSIGLIDTLFKTVFYWAHEKAWERVGKRTSETMPVGDSDSSSD